MSQVVRSIPDAFASLARSFTVSSFTSFRRQKVVEGTFPLGARKNPSTCRGFLAEKFFGEKFEGNFSPVLGLVFFVRLPLPEFEQFRVGVGISAAALETIGQLPGLVCLREVYAADVPTAG